MWLLFAFIDNIFFGKNRYGTDSVALIKKISVSGKSNNNRAFTFFLFALNETARKNRKDVTQLSLLAQSLVLTCLKLPFQRVRSKYYPFLKYKRILSFHQNVLSSPCKPYY